jgi:transcriptional regulator of heat shock response
VPTDKGYRFFVDQLLDNGLKDFEKDFDRQMADSLEFIRRATKFLADQSSELALGYSADKKIIWKEGWGDLLHEPEFSRPGFAASFAEMLDDLEENIEELFLPEACLPVGMVKIYIGRENPVSRADDFTIITSGFENGFIALLGPKRMSYDKNIELIQKLWQEMA